MKSNVCAIVVTYNRLSLLKQCLEKILNQTLPVSHIVVINNKSTDGTTEYLDTIDSPIILVHNMPKNEGGAKGFSEGMKYAYKHTSDDTFWIMDDDTFPDSDALENLIVTRNKTNEKIGFLCSNVRWKDQSSTNIPAASSKWSAHIDAGLVKVDAATFVSVLVSREIVTELGFPTAELFIWGDDTEFTTRISTRYPCYFVSTSRVLHYSEKNISDVTIMDDAVERLSRYKFMYRNLIYIDKKYHSKFKACKRFIGNLFAVIETLIKSKDHRLKRSQMILVGSIQGLVFNPNIEYPIRKR